MKTPLGILYEGPSQLDGRPIVCIVTGESANPKTGPMLQTWILRQDIHPIDAVQSREDMSICGSCPLAGPMKQRRCYVQLNPTLSVWAKYHAGGYAPVDLDVPGGVYAGEAIRIGSYGDPAAVPLEVWQKVLRGVTRWTGYTHQWKTADPAYARFLMASVETYTEQSRAAEMGYRTFRVAETRLPWEVSCPASDEAGKRTTCLKCGLCNGQAGKIPTTVVIRPHGTFVGRFEGRT